MKKKKREDEFFGELDEDPDSETRDAETDGNSHRNTAKLFGICFVIFIFLVGILSAVYLSQHTH